MAEHILVIGATGPTGRHVVDGLTKRDVSVRAMTRDPNKAPTTWGANVTVVQGDLRDASTLARALTDDVTGIIICSGTRNVFGFGNNTGREMEIGGMRNLLGVLNNRTPRVAYVSTILVTRRRSNPFGFLLNTLRGGVLGHKLAAEELLRSSDLDYFILRPGGLTNGDAKTQRYTFDQGDRIMGQVSRADVAEVLCAWTTDRLPARITCEMIADPKTAFQPNWASAFQALHPDN